MTKRRLGRGKWFALLWASQLMAGTLASPGCNGPAGDGDDLLEKRVLDLLTQESRTPPAWKVGIVYPVGALVSYAGISYVCRQPHKGTVGWEPPRAPSLWQRPTPIGPASWTNQTPYVVGSEVTFAGQTWVCRRDHVSQPDWIPGKTPSLWALPNRPPAVSILAPENGSQHPPATGVGLQAVVSDPDGPSPFAGRVAWSSDVEGPLCEGLACVSPPLRLGTHVITAGAIDPGGATASASVRIVVNTAPTLAIVLPPEGAAFFVGQAITFRGAASDPEQDIPGSAMSWSSHLDGALGTGPELSSAALSPGTHRITLFAADDFGATGVASVAVIVSPLFGPPSAVIQEPPHGTRVSPDSAVRLVGLGFDPEDGLLPDDGLSWVSDIDGPLGTGSVLDVLLSGPAGACGPEERRHRVTLTATDSDGNIARYDILVRVAPAC